MDRFCGMVMIQDSTAQCKKRYLQEAVIGTELGHHDRSKIRSTEQLGENLEILHEAIEYIKYLNKTKYKNDCLLYTSPSPRDQRGSRMPSSA